MALCPVDYKHILFLISLCVVIHYSACKKQKDLQIITEYQPDECWQTADNGDDVMVHYTGTLESGAVFDTSKQPNRGPLPFKLGEGKVIPGWERGIHGMCVGERRKLIIPPHLAYGEKGYPPAIPPHATLTFETELVSLEKKSVEESIFTLLRFFMWPAAILIAIYYVYDRYKKAPTKKELKEERRNRKGKRH